MKINSTLTALILYMSLAQLIHCNYFSHGQTVLPHYKTKMNIGRVYEDRAFSSNHLLMVSDGIGGSGFPSGSLANSVLYGVASAFFPVDKDQKIQFDNGNIQAGIRAGVEYYNQLFEGDIMKELIDKNLLNYEPCSM